MKWVHIKGNMYKCPACGTRFTIGKKWKRCPVCEQKLSGVREQSISDYIKREDAIKAVNHLQKQLQLNANELEFGIMLKDVFRDVIPSADVEPIRHSVWRVASADPDKEYECMECKKAVGWKYLYCPNCGARMDGKSDE